MIEDLARTALWPLIVLVVLLYGIHAISKAAWSPEAVVALIRMLVLPLVTLAFAWTVCFAFVYQQRVNAEAFLGIAGMVIAFWLKPPGSAPPPGQ